tara:strand:+ start:250 stop:543 length:294 start_codon:yes stop_codon:yes gene_type:complete
MSWQDILKNELNVKTLEEIASELDKAVETHASQAKRIRELIAQHNKGAPTRMQAPQYITNRPRVPTIPQPRDYTAGDRALMRRAKNNLDEEKRRKNQ